MGQSTIQNPHGTNRQIIHEIGPQYLARRGVSNVSSGRKAWGASGMASTHCSRSY